jgi:transposase
MDLTEAQWDAIKAHFPAEEMKSPGPKGGRPWRDPRAIVNAVLWVLRTGAPWADLPRRYPPYQTCHRRFQRWCKDGTLERALRSLAEDLYMRGKVDLTEAYIDGTHAGAKKGGLSLGELGAVVPPRSWRWQTAMACLSPQGLRVVNDMKHSWPNKPSIASSPRTSQR